MPASFIAQMALSGALMGLVYALVAYGFQLTYATSKSINFGQGELVMVSAFISLTLLKLGIPYVLVVPLGLLAGAALGLVVERAGVRLALEQRSEGWILLTIIIGLFMFSFAENVWGRDDRPFPTPIPSDPIHVLGLDVTPLELSVAIGVFAVMGLVELFKRRTLLGKAFEAVSADRDAGELMGISATRTVMLSYALSGAVAALAGMLVSPITTVGPTMASALVLTAFSVAVVAGLESGFGVVVVGVFLGALEGLASLYIGSGWREAPGLVLLILALAVRPTGVFAIMALIEAFKRVTLLGKAFDAVSADPDAGELMGISARHTVMLSYALSGLVAALAGILVSPITTVGPTMASALVLKAFSVAVVAGLDSGFGVVVVGMFLGALESLASFTIGSGWREMPGLVLLILALAVRPTGIFGKAVIRKV